MINPATLEEEPTSDVQMTVADLSNPVPVDATRDGELFVVNTKETERTTIHTSASTGNYKVERTVVIPGYTVSQAPCGQRVFYLPIKSSNITAKALSVAGKNLNEQTQCASLDKALVIWESLHETVIASGPSAIPSDAKYPKELLEYNWARGNYQACITLGYEQQCEIAEAAFRNFDKSTLKKLAISERDKSMVLRDVTSVPLQISYTKMKKLFAFHDYLEAAKTTEILLAGFEKNVGSWEHLNISKSRLYVDATISWLHYADSLTSKIDMTERKKRCGLYERALSNAKRALWLDFRQRQVPLMEEKIANCLEGLPEPDPTRSRI
jgi:hypothetical protein